MNFQELLQRMADLDQPVGEELVGGQHKLDVDHDGDIGGDDLADLRSGDVDECGMPGMSNMPSGMMGAPKQQDSVNMNVNMSGSGAGGIRDLMAILKHIEDTEDGHDHDDMLDPKVIIKKMSPPDMNPLMSQEEFANEPDEIYQGVDAVTGRGDDIHSNSGDHRMRQTGLPVGQPTMESLVQRLSSQYNEIKSR